MAQSSVHTGGAAAGPGFPVGSTTTNPNSTGADSGTGPGQPTLPTLEHGKPRAGSRAARLAHPRTRDTVKELAADHGVCVRPVTLRRTDTQTGTTELVDLPCGATREDKCPSCAKRARRLRQQQIREGWHRTEEPVPEPAPASDEQVGLVVLRAHLEYDRAQTLVRPMPADQRAAELEQIDTAIAELDDQISGTGLRGKAASVTG